MAFVFGLGYTFPIGTNTVHLLLRLGVIVFAVIDRALRVDGIADGDHFFRQTHVLANIDKMLANGLFTAPRSWNQDLFLHFYDFPIYQGVVAVLVRGFDAPVPVVAEAVNAACMVALLLLSWRLCSQLALGAVTTTVALAVLALAPLGRFWFAASSVDPMVVTLAVLSLVGWFELQDAHGARRRAFGMLVWLASAFLATLIKSPVYAATALTIAWQILRQHGLRGLVHRHMLVFGATMATAMAVFLVVSANANADLSGWPDRGTELAWYFGSWNERSSWSPHGAILGRIIKQVLSVPLALVAMLALVTVRHWQVQGRTRSTVLVWSVGSVLVCLLFLHVNVVHGYYQLPCLVALALLAGIGVEGTVIWFEARRLLARRGRSWGVVVNVVLLVALAGGAIWSSERYLTRLRAPSTAELRAAGAFVQAHTAPDDFLLYARPKPDDNPAFLYFAQRNGANVQGQLSAAALQLQYQKAAAVVGGRLVLFVPVDCTAGAGWQELATDVAGTLLVVP